MGEDGGAVSFNMFAEPDAGAGLGQDRCERGLANQKRITPQVVAVQFNQVEGVQEDMVVMAVVANEVKRRHAVVTARDSFAINDAGARAQAGYRINNQQEAP